MANLLFCEKTEEKMFSRIVLKVETGNQTLDLQIRKPRRLSKLLTGSIRKAIHISEELTNF